MFCVVGHHRNSFASPSEFWQSNTKSCPVKGLSYLGLIRNYPENSRLSTETRLAIGRRHQAPLPAKVPAEQPPKCIKAERSFMFMIQQISKSENNSNTGQGFREWKKFYNILFTQREPSQRVSIACLRCHFQKHKPIQLCFITKGIPSIYRMNHQRVCQVGFSEV